MWVYLIILSFATASYNYPAVDLTEGTTVREEVKESEETDNQFVVYVSIGNKSCSGTILNESWVITLKDCANGTSEGWAWVSAGAGSNGTATPQRHPASLHWGSPGSRLILLHLDRPLQRPNAPAALPLASSPEDFAEPCKVIGFDSESPESTAGPLHAAVTRVLRGCKCMGAAVTPTPAGTNDSAGAPRNHTAPAAAGGEETKRLRRNADGSANNTADGDVGEILENSRNTEDSKQPIVHDSVLCSTGATDDVTLVGSPLVCRGVVVGLATGKSLDKSQQSGGEKWNNYYALIQPQDKWIVETIPTIHVSSVNETTGHVELSEKDSKRKNLWLVRRMSKVRWPWWVSLLTDLWSQDSNSTDSNLESDDEVDPLSSIYQAFSGWLPVSQRVQATIWWYDSDDQPNSKLRIHPVDKRESLHVGRDVEGSATTSNMKSTSQGTELIDTVTTLRPLKRVKRRAVSPEALDSSSRLVIPLSLFRKTREVPLTQSLSTGKRTPALSWRNDRYSSAAKKPPRSLSLW